MKFNSFIESLREKGDSKFGDNKLSTDVISIEQISQPINNDRRDLFYKYAEVNAVIQKFKNIVVGEIANFTEKKSVTHFEYKKASKKDFIEHQVQALSLANRIRKNFKRILIFSIGGSNLGPALINDIFNFWLKPNGRLIIGIDFYFENKISHSWPESCGIKDMKLFSEKDWFNFFKSAGYSDIKSWRYGEKEDWKGTLIVTGIK